MLRQIPMIVGLGPNVGLLSPWIYRLPRPSDFNVLFSAGIRRYISLEFFTDTRAEAERAGLIFERYPMLAIADISVELIDEVLDRLADQTLVTAYG